MNKRIIRLKYKLFIKKIKGRPKANRRSRKCQPIKLFCYLNTCETDSRPASSDNSSCQPAGEGANRLYMTWLAGKRPTTRIITLFHIFLVMTSEVLKMPYLIFWPKHGWFHGEKNWCGDLHSVYLLFLPVFVNDITPPRIRARRIH